MSTSLFYFHLIAIPIVYFAIGTLFSILADYIEKDRFEKLFFSHLIPSFKLGVLVFMIILIPVGLIEDKFKPLIFFVPLLVVSLSGIFIHFCRKIIKNEKYATMLFKSEIEYLVAKDDFILSMKQMLVVFSFFAICAIVLLGFSIRDIWSLY